MAKVVESLPSRNRTSPYPWDEWLDGRVWCLTEGEDFGPSSGSFRQMVYTAGKRRGLAVTVNIRPEGVYLQARKLGEGA